MISHHPCQRAPAQNHFCSLPCGRAFTLVLSFASSGLPCSVTPACAGSLLHAPWCTFASALVPSVAFSCSVNPACAGLLSVPLVRAFVSSVRSWTPLSEGAPSFWAVDSPSGASPPHPVQPSPGRRLYRVSLMSACVRGFCPWTLSQRESHLSGPWTPPRGLLHPIRSNRPPDGDCIACLS